MNEEHKKRKRNVRFFFSVLLMGQYLSLEID